MQNHGRLLFRAKIKRWRVCKIRRAPASLPANYKSRGSKEIAAPRPLPPAPQGGNGPQSPFPLLFTAKNYRSPLNLLCIN